MKEPNKSRMCEFLFDKKVSHTKYIFGCFHKELFNVGIIFLCQLEQKNYLVNQSHSTKPQNSCTPIINGFIFCTFGFGTGELR